ncbi:MoaD/ThiS family protein [Moorellaceae bacterium AZ2]|uniref:sulfur carrier protein ThiS n=1 Tax=Thermanaeromonas sp. C210 TaxID=2731925 RepID=UPI00210F3C05|nr:MoaD/ThiS family protein [Thermanaeromonas sp. C210]
MLFKTGKYKLDIPSPQSISSLLKLLSSQFPFLQDPTLANVLGLSLNGRRVPQEEWDRTLVEDGDRVEIFNAVVGG